MSLTFTRTPAHARSLARSLAASALVDEAGVGITGRIATQPQPPNQQQQNESSSRAVTFELPGSRASLHIVDDSDGDSGSDALDAEAIRGPWHTDEPDEPEDAVVYQYDATHTRRRSPTGVGRSAAVLTSLQGSSSTSMSSSSMSSSLVISGSNSPRTQLAADEQDSIAVSGGSISDGLSTSGPHVSTPRAPVFCMIKPLGSPVAAKRAAAASGSSVVVVTAQPSATTPVWSSTSRAAQSTAATVAPSHTSPRPQAANTLESSSNSSSSTSNAPSAVATESYVPSAVAVVPIEDSTPLSERQRQSLLQQQQQQQQGKSAGSSGASSPLLLMRRTRRSLSDSDCSSSSSGSAFESSPLQQHPLLLANTSTNEWRDHSGSHHIFASSPVVSVIENLDRKDRSASTEWRGGRTHTVDEYSSEIFQASDNDDDLSSLATDTNESDYYDDELESESERPYPRESLAFTSNPLFQNMLLQSYLDLSTTRQPYKREVPISVTNPLYQNARLAAYLHSRRRIWMVPTLDDLVTLRINPLFNNDSLREWMLSKLSHSGESRMVAPSWGASTSTSTSTTTTTTTTATTAATFATAYIPGSTSATIASTSSTNATNAPPTSGPSSSAMGASAALAKDVRSSPLKSLTRFNIIKRRSVTDMLAEISTGSAASTSSNAGGSGGGSGNGASSVASASGSGISSASSNAATATAVNGVVTATTSPPTATASPLSTSGGTAASLGSEQPPSPSLGYRNPIYRQFVPVRPGSAADAIKRSQASRSAVPVTPTSTSPTGGTTNSLSFAVAASSSSSASSASTSSSSSTGSLTSLLSKTPPMSRRLKKSTSGPTSTSRPRPDLSPTRR